jgi:hypothetical protein
MRKRYAFLYDEVLPAERAALKQRLKVRAAAGVGGGGGCGRAWSKGRRVHAPRQGEGQAAANTDRHSLPLPRTPPPFP